MNPLEKGIYSILVILLLLWCAAFTLQPVLMTYGEHGKKAGMLIYLAFSQLCHQIPERSLMLNGSPMAVCSRCAGIYYGDLVLLLGYPFLCRMYRRIQPTVKWLCLAALLMAVDFIIEKTGIFQPGNWIRFFTGLFFGWTAGVFIVTGILEWLGSTEKERI
jgi:uncharacterized membrane protein